MFELTDSFNLNQDQKGFPNELFAVKMYALATELPKKISGSRPKRKAANRPAIIK